jgi:myosin-5
MTQAPRTSRTNLVKGRSQANAVAQQALVAHWQSIVKSLNNYLKIMRANYVSGTYKYDEIVSLFCSLNSITFFKIVTIQVPSFLVCKVFTQIFSFINVQLFNR